ncbi:MAG: hypothetical protein ACJA1A_001624 [Saprospiraceae bacterium]|jgi:hypothetical protein
MTRLIYLSLLVVIPFLVTAEHGRDRLNGKWISPFHGNVIRVKVKRDKVRVKNLTRTGWTTFRPARRGKFVDRNGNSIQIKNIHEMIYRSNCGDERIRFVKKGHVHHHHVCNSNCGIGQDYFSYHDNYGHYGSDNNNESYSGYDGYNAYNGYSENRPDRWANRDDERSTRNISGRYFVREIDDFVVIENTRNGLKARRGNLDWVKYRQNRYRKNEYIDSKGNKYNVRSDGSIFWKNKSGTNSLNLTK